MDGHAAALGELQDIGSNCCASTLERGGADNCLFATGKHLTHDHLWTDNSYTSVTSTSIVLPLILSTLVRHSYPGIGVYFVHFLLAPVFCVSRP